MKQKALEVLQLIPEVPQELSDSINGVTSASLLSDLITGLMDLSPEEKQEILETSDLKNRLDRLLSLVNYRLEVLRVSRDIDEQTKNRLDDRHREALLREQLRTIQTQLGDIDDSSSEAAELAEKIENAKMPEEVKTHALKELNRFRNMSESSGEYSMLHTYLEWLTELPWAISSEDRTDIAEARKILDEDHYGLEKVKKRILEFLAVHKLNPEGKSPLLCFIGPPGVGKTSLGQSIAKATGREFVRVSMGGVHDEAEIRGTGELISVRYPAISFRRSVVQARTIASCCWMKWTSSATAFMAILQQHCSKCSILPRTAPSGTIIWRFLSICRK